MQMSADRPWIVSVHGPGCCLSSPVGLYSKVDNWRLETLLGGLGVAFVQLCPTQVNSQLWRRRFAGRLRLSSFLRQEDE